jgi:hypothetical protein
MIADASSHRRSDAERLMHTAKVVMHVVKGNSCNMICDLLRERIGKPSESAHPHPHREVLAFDVTGRNMLRVRITDLVLFFAAVADCG